VRKSIIAKSIVFLLISPFSINNAFGKNIENHLIVDQLESILNKKEDRLLKDLFLEKTFKEFDKQYLDFTKKYKNSTWSFTTRENHPEKKIVDIKIRSTTTIGNQIYNLRSRQIVKIETINNKIKNYKVINEESTLNSQDSPLVINVISPDKVLTGERYEINLIIEKPLDSSLIASGMIVIKNHKNINISKENFGIKLNQSGGLFKYIQAPLEPGTQTISAIITHPEGIYTITKKINVGS
tara:strand:- start:114 stop:833 length:720 start_codon:yes stop_codon:yes gene_type:complete